MQTTTQRLRVRIKRSTSFAKGKTYQEIYGDRWIEEVEKRVKSYLNKK